MENFWPDFLSWITEDSTARALDEISSQSHPGPELHKHVPVDEAGAGASSGTAHGLSQGR